MPGLAPGIQVFFSYTKQGVDGRDKPGHDGGVLNYGLAKVAMMPVEPLT